MNAEAVATSADPDLSGAIASYDASREIASVLATGYAAAPPVHAGWRTYAAQLPVRAVAVHPRGGQYWLAGAWGVTRINTGERLAETRFHSEHGLPGNPVSCLCLDADGIPWAAAAEARPGGEAGLAWLDGEAWRVNPPLVPPRTASSERRASPVRCLAADPDGGVWAATGSALYRIPARDAAPKLVVQWPDPPAVDVFGLLPDDRGVLAATPRGLFRVAAGGAFTPEPTGSLKACTALCRDRLGGIWAGGPGGLQRLDGQSKLIELPGVRHVRALACHTRRVWALTEAALGFWQEDAGWRQFAPGFIPEAIYALAAYDTDRLALLGTENGHSFALLPLENPKMDPVRMGWRILPRAEDQSALGQCNALAGPDDQGRIWVGGAGGVAVIPKSPDLAPEPIDCSAPAALAAPIATAELAVISSHDVVDLFGPDPGGRMWVRVLTEGLFIAESQAAARELVCEDGLQPILEPMPPPLQVAPDEQGMPGCMTGRGLWRFDGEHWALTDPPLPGRRAPAAPTDPLVLDARYPTALACSSAGAWWAGSDDGLFVLREGKWQAQQAAGLPLKGVRCLLVVGRTVWIGTTAGLWTWEDGEVRRQAAGVAYPHGPVQALAAGTGGVWVALEGEVVRFDPATGRPGAPITPVNSGLASAVVNAMLEADGELWLATAGGVSRWTIA